VCVGGVLLGLERGEQRKEFLQRVGESNDEVECMFHCIIAVYSLARFIPPSLHPSIPHLYWLDYIDCIPSMH